MNEFDFYYFEVSSPRVTPLKKAGIDRDKIKSSQRWSTGARYPTVTYTATLGYCHARQCSNTKLAELSNLYPSLDIQVKYHCSD